MAVYMSSCQNPKQRGTNHGQKFKHRLPAPLFKQIKCRSFQSCSKLNTSSFKYLTTSSVWNSNQKDGARCTLNKAFSNGKGVNYLALSWRTKLSCKFWHLWRKCSKAVTNHMCIVIERYQHLHLEQCHCHSVKCSITSPWMVHMTNVSSKTVWF